MQVITKNAAEVPRSELPGDAPGRSGEAADVERNVGTLDRILRVSLGGALAIWALARLLGGGGVVGRLADVALIALGVDFVVTGIRGYCPLYKQLGWSTAGRRAGR